MDASDTFPQAPSLREGTTSQHDDHSTHVSAGRDAAVADHGGMAIVTHFTLAGGTLPTPPALRPIAPPHPFVDREAERCDLVQALATRPGDVHTLAGMGGVGKTALAARVVHDVTDAFPGGVLWLSLEMAPHPDTLWAQIVAAYGYVPGAHPAGDACAVLNQHRPLLVIDNAESAPATARALLQGRGAAAALLTTRDRAVAAGYGGPPCDVCPLPRADDMALFVARAGPGHDPALVDQLCELLGDLPLAVNLAAGYLIAYAEPLAGYLALLRGSRLGEVLHLDGRRDMSVPVTFDLTYRALDDDARLALAVLALDGGETTGLPAVAAGAGWTLLQVCEPTVRLNLREGEGRARHALNALVRSSLALREVARYTLHPLVRRYAAEQMADDQRDAVHARLLAHYLAYAQAHKQPPAADYDALEAERPNLLAAMDRAYQAEQWATVRRFMWALDEYLDVRGYWSERRTRLEQAIRAAEAEGHQRDAAAFGANWAGVLYRTGNWATARWEYQRVLTIFEELGKPLEIATVYHQLGLLAQSTGAHAEARQLYHHSLDIVEEQGDMASIAKTLNQLGSLAQDTGNYAEARRLYRRSLGIKEQLGDKVGIATTLHGLGLLAQTMGEYDKARRLLQHSLDSAEEREDKASIASSLHDLAGLTHRMGDFAKARCLYRRSLDIAEKLGNQRGIAIALHSLGIIALNVSDYAEARRLLRRSLNISEELGDRVGIVNSEAALRLAACSLMLLMAAGGFGGFRLGISFGLPVALLAGTAGCIIGLMSYWSVLAYVLTCALFCASMGYSIGSSLDGKIVCGIAGSVIGAVASRRITSWLFRLRTNMWIARIRYRLLARRSRRG
ncbi:MAG: tetratricopeptide repeat protein [Chloroflexi bacterium]|nr:tetratricopeptide repeat protein [Chloroflexota bacterium]MBU1746431.1 tetratricopeptide repeat protein [Chloroflexota bacterium]